MLYHEKKHKQKIMNNEIMKVKRVFKSYEKTYQVVFSLSFMEYKNINA
jgi:hypothetical protein